MLELVAEGRPDVRFPLAVGEVSVGRGADADIRLDSPEVSRRHARLRHRRGGIEVEDLSSSNGTLVNGVPVHGRARLGPGDRVQFGPARFRLERGGDDDATTVGPRVAFGVGSQSAGSIWNVGGDVHHSTTVTEEDPWDELFHGTGLGRLFLAIGLLAVVAGFALWVGFIFTGFMPPDGTDPFSFNPFTDARRILGVPQPILGFGLFAGGGLLAGIGSGLSRAARRRRGEQVGPLRRPSRRRFS